MKLRIVSDLHLEFDQSFNLPEMEDDINTILILAGDIHLAKKIHKFYPLLEEWNERFYHVFWVFGNHEFYKYQLNNARAKVDDRINTLTNVTILENEHKILFDPETDERVAFIGCTLWTDYDRADPMKMLKCQFDLNDYNWIRLGHETEYEKNAPGVYRKIQPRDLWAKNWYSVLFLKDMAEFLYVNKKVVITHHAPSYQSVQPHYINMPAISGYTSDLEPVIDSLDANLWVHGHIHDSSDYYINNTRVVCNPQGYYPDDLNDSFDPYKLLTL